MNNFSEYTFSLENLTYIPNIYEKIFIVLVWLLIEIPGNIMLLGIIQFDRLGGDPLKRRIHDQVHIENFVKRTKKLVNSSKSISQKKNFKCNLNKMSSQM